jgi:hypothetical protein
MTANSTPNTLIQLRIGESKLDPTLSFSPQTNILMPRPQNNSEHIYDLQLTGVIYAISTAPEPETLDRNILSDPSSTTPGSVLRPVALHEAYDVCYFVSHSFGR